jgi:tetraacyldisaccharide 4'-kinase
MRAPDFWARNDISARAVSAALAPVAWLYGASVAYKRDHAKPYHAKAKVVCVGNLTAGGSGKTPVAMAIAHMFLSRGARVTFLTRGYGGAMPGPLRVETGKHDARDVGDEPLLLAAVAPTIVARDRNAGARLADRQDAEIIIMDDGHQNFAIAKDLSIVVVDAESGFGNGRVLPAGPLREPVRQGLARADAVVFMGDGAQALPGYRGQIVHAHLSPAMSLPADTRIIAFAGIGRPAKFFSTLRAAGADLAECHAFADHHPYTPDEIFRLKARASSAGAVLMTTEKDFVRMNERDRTGIQALPIRAHFDKPETMERLLDRICSQDGYPE